MIRTIGEAVRLHRLIGDDTPLVIDWRYVADRLAEELTAIVRRFDGDPNPTDADQGRLAREAVAMREHQLAVEELRDDEDE
jgi:hypothetical protein